MKAGDAARRDRPAAVPGAAHAGRGPARASDQALLKNAQLDLERYQTLLAQDSIAKQQVDTQEALVRQYEGTVQIRPGRRSTTRSCSSPTRAITAPIGGRLGLRQVDPGNIVHAADANGLVVITQLQPITVVFPIPEDNAAARAAAARRPASRSPVEAWDRDSKVKLATGKLAHRRQPDRHDHRHGQAEGGVRQRRPRALPEPVRQRAHAGRHADATRRSFPSAAIQRGAPGTFVYVVKDDKHGHASRR